MINRTDMHSVREVCDKYGITRKTLFYYDRSGLLKPTKREGKQQFKYYDEKSLSRLELILEYRAAGLTIQEIKQVVDLNDKAKILHVLISIKKRLDAEVQQKNEEIRNLDILLNRNS